MNYFEQQTIKQEKFKVIQVTKFDGEITDEKSGLTSHIQSANIFYLMPTNTESNGSHKVGYSVIKQKVPFEQHSQILNSFNSSFDPTKNCSEMTFDVEEVISGGKPSLKVIGLTKPSGK